MRTFAVINLGCKVNRVESDQMERLMRGFGLLSAKPNAADIIVVNTCTVTAAADKKTRKAVRAALAANDYARIIVTGCSASQFPHVFEEMSERVEVVGKWDVDARLQQLCALDEARVPKASGPECETEPDGDLPAMRHRRGVKVQDGCNGRCSYCIIWKARGPERSVPAIDVLEQARLVCAEGASEVVLTGINLGRYASYGLDLSDLLVMLLEEGLPCRYRLSSIEPPDVTDKLLEVMRESAGKVCWHLHIPLQSGSSKVLREMARPYSGDDYIDLIARVRRMLPCASITTDVIAGFPGETDADHGATVSLARKCAFSKIHVFPYSAREGTEAARRVDQVASDVKAARAMELRRLSDSLRAADLENRRGTIELAVADGAGLCVTDSYHEVAAPAGCASGAMVEVVL